jgi:hypothetical protein
MAGVLAAFTAGVLAAFTAVAFMGVAVLMVAAVEGDWL